MPKKVTSGLFILLSLFFVNTGAWAVVLSPDILGTDFRFNNPGARANAMGGAFIGLADDATAAYTNPAGLTILTKPEISVEYKIGKVTTEITDQVGRKEYKDTVSGLSFLSYVYPAENATIALFRHQLLNTETNYYWLESTTRFQKIKVSLDAVTLGIGTGLKLTDTFSIGMSIGVAQLDYTVMDKYFESTNAPYPNALHKQNVSDTDNAEHYTISLLWNPLEELNLGLVYRMGPEFETTKMEWKYYENLGGPGDGGYYQEWEYDQVLKVPDIYGLGISYRFLPNLTATMDVNYIEYSDLADDFITEEDGTKESWFTIDDEVEIRAGLEYILQVNDTPLALRAGYYYRPDHRVYYDGGDDPFFINTFGDKGDDDDHIFSLGFGAVLSENLQIDVAAGAGKFIKEGSLSLVYRF